MSDQGTIFNPLNAQYEPDFNGKSEAGFGLYMIKRLIDRVDYTPKMAEQGQVTDY